MNHSESRHLQEEKNWKQNWALLRVLKRYCKSTPTARPGGHKQSKNNKALQASWLQQGFMIQEIRDWDEMVIVVLKKITIQQQENKGQFQNLPKILMISKSLGKQLSWLLRLEHNLEGVSPLQMMFNKHINRENTLKHDSLGLLYHFRIYTSRHNWWKRQSSSLPQKWKRMLGIISQS